VVTQYQTTRHVEEALARLTEAYMAIGIVARRKPPPPCSGTIFLTAAGTRTPIILLKSGGLEPSENKGSYISRAFKKWVSVRN